MPFNFGIFIFIELADGGNFAKFLKAKGLLEEKEAKLYYAQILCGINHMHSLGIAHRDIKLQVKIRLLIESICGHYILFILQNVLLAKNDKSISKDFTLLVADFGLSRIVHHDNDGDIQKNRTVCGTPIFMAPEILTRKVGLLHLTHRDCSLIIYFLQPYNAFLVDMWALGVTVFILMTLELPFDFKDMNKAIQNMLDRKWGFPKEKGKMKSSPSGDLKEMTTALLEPDPGKRLSMSAQITHKWCASEYKKAQGLANKKK